MDEISTTGQLSSEAWIGDLPDPDYSVLDKFDSQEDASDIATGRPLLRRSGNSATQRALANRRLPIELDRADLPGLENGSLTDLMRSYLNGRKLTATVVHQSGPARSSPSPGDSTNAPMASVRASTEELLGNVMRFVVQPGISDTGLMTLSIMGLGEFTLVGQGGTLSVAFGDSFILGLPGVTENGTLPGAFAAGGLGSPAPPGGLDGAYAGWGSPESGAFSGSGGGAVGEESDEAGKNGSSGSSAETSQSPGKPRLSRLLVLAFDIFTYPGTILVSVALLLLQLFKAGSTFHGLRKARRHRPLAKQPAVKRRRSSRSRRVKIRFIRPAEPGK